MAKQSVMKSGKLAASMLVAVAALAGGAQVHAADWSDTSISYRYGTKFDEPYNGADIKKSIVNLSHVSGYKYGTNFLSVDMLMSDKTDNDAQEAYVVYRNTIDIGKVSGSPIAFGPVRGAGLTVGFDWNAKNTGYASKKRMLVVGPTLMMDVPGFLNISAVALHESNEPSFITSRYTYKVHPALMAAWGIPFGSSGFALEGFMNYIAAKGANETGGGTYAETNIDTQIMYDLGTPMGLGKNSLRAGIEYQYWRNKFGNPCCTVKGSLAKTPMLRVEYHF